MDRRPQGAPDQEKMSREQKKIAKWLKQVQFRKTLIGGVDERDVWKKIAELNEMYNVALAAERARFDALLEEHGIQTEPDDGRYDSGTNNAGGERR